MLQHDLRRSSQTLNRLTLLIHGKLTMMAEIEAPVNPYAIFQDRHIILRINRPLSSSRKLLLVVSCHGDVRRKQDLNFVNNGDERDGRERRSEWTLLC